MICSSVNLLFLKSAILLGVGGLLLLQVDTTGAAQVSRSLEGAAVTGQTAITPLNTIALNLLTL